jgi:hypothetical protein
MAVTCKAYGNFLKCALNKEIDWDTDTIKIMLCTSSYTPNQDTHIYKDIAVTNEVSGAGYTTGGATLTGKTITYDDSTNTITLDANDVSWANSTITARYAVIYDDTPASNKPLIGYMDFGEDKISTDGTFSITVAADGLYKIVVS